MKVARIIFPLRMDTTPGVFITDVPNKSNKTIVWCFSVKPIYYSLCQNVVFTPSNIKFTIYDYKVKGVVLFFFIINYHSVHLNK